ncbi:hypothetical protein MPB2EB_1372 [Mycoavidus sp. B2-EB]|nr:hypothetical protein MPB2EB_1372 [Mycoavidus sp. B2-EB]
MAMAIFDTLRCSKRLQEAGVPTAQAEAEAEVLSEVFAVNLQELVTQKDLLATKEELRHEIKDVRNDLSNQIKDVRNELNNKIDGVRNELSNKIDGVRNELSHEIKDLRFGLLKWIIGLAIAQSGLLSVFKFWPAGLTA